MALSKNRIAEIVKKCTEFVVYVHEFYGPDGVYPMNATIGQISEATQILLKRGDDVAFDSIDREKVRDIMIEKFGLKSVRIVG